MTQRLIFLVAALGLGMAVQAQPPGRQSSEQPVTGAETRAWLSLQKSGTAAPSDPRPMSGEVGERVYERYLESYTRPIPEAFEREGFGSGGQSQ